MSVPPTPSSHTPKAARYVIRITRLAMLGVFLLLFGVSFPAISWPAAFGWLYLIPIATAVWVLRTQTTITGTGLELRSVFGKRAVDWTDVKGVRFPKRGWARADLTNGTEVPMPAVSFDRLPELAAASQGRIPDPYAPSPDSAEETDSQDSAERE
ncbi:PH domain-containing protein [Antrihabitans cavernicola]|nr:PH domain-containing protein [Spelaeibacter cavernicola]